MEKGWLTSCNIFLSQELPVVISTVSPHPAWCTTGRWGVNTGPWHPLSQPRAQTCPELSPRPAVLGRWHKGMCEGTRGGAKSTGLNPKNMISALALILTAQLRDTLVSCQCINSWILDISKQLRDLLSRDKQMCCGVLQCNRRVDQALSFKNTVFYLYLFI